MKDSKIERVWQKVLILKRQFLQVGVGLFDQALGDYEVTAIMSVLLPPHRERIYPPWTPCVYSSVKCYRLTAPAKT